MTNIEDLDQSFSTSALLKFGVINFLAIDIALPVRYLTTWMNSKNQLLVRKSCPILLQ
jgi:hypothetical protein